MESARGEVGGDDAVAGNLGGAGIGAEGLADSAWRMTADAASERGVGDDFAGGDAAEGIVDFGREGGGPGGGFASGPCRCRSAQIRNLRFQMALILRGILGGVGEDAIHGAESAHDAVPSVVVGIGADELGVGFDHDPRVERDLAFKLVL